jgi:preprotein translocase subunit SecD
MQARMRWWLTAILALVVLAAVGVFEPVKLTDRKDPTTGETVEPLNRVGPFRIYRPRFGITLGLDLRGGSHLVLQAQSEGVFEYLVPELAEQTLSEEQEVTLYGEIKTDVLPSEKIGSEKRDVMLDEGIITVRTRARTQAQVDEQSATILELLKARFPDVEEKRSEFMPITRDNLVSIERILENRVNAYGVAEPLIQRQPPDRIIVELPGVKDPESAKEMIRQTARLEFRHIPREYAFGDHRPEETPTAGGTSSFTFSNVAGDVVPTKDVIEMSRVIVTGRSLKANSRVIAQPGQKIQVSFELEGSARDEFERFTRLHVKHYLAIVLDDVMISCPVIESTIPGRGVISGGFIGDKGMAEAKDLSILLNAGALPLDLKYIENRTVSAQLGHDDLTKSLIAGLLGLAAVLVFMVLYYRLPGLLADIALLMYCILLLGAIRLVGQVLTLPGILAVILSIGMAVDANIIIFERLKEEIRTGKTMRSAVDAAFKRAWAAILDANVCSIGTGIVLFYFGTGPIKGFAVALIIGVGVSLFTAVTLTRLLVNMATNTAMARNTALFGVSPGDIQGS